MSPVRPGPLRQEGQLTHRGRAKQPARTEAEEHLATGPPNQLWSWDTSYLKTTVCGRFYSLYMIVDTCSRRIMGWVVHDEKARASHRRVYIMRASDLTRLRAHVRAGVSVATRPVAGSRVQDQISLAMLDRSC